MARGLILSSSALLLAACGGGGGGSGGGLPGGPAPSNEYEVRVTADRMQLPLNLDKNPCINPPSSRSAYATALYVEAFRRGTMDPIPGGEEVFSCVVQQGIESAALYYFRGEDDDKVEIKCGEDDVEIEGAYRSIVLGANAGGASFHMISNDKVGPVQVRCSATDPQSGKQAFGEITIQVGGDATGRPAQVRVNKMDQNDRAWGFLYPQGVYDPSKGPQGVNEPTMLRLQAQLLDEAGQRVNGGSSDNLRACLIGSEDAASSGAYVQSRGEVRYVAPLGADGNCRPANSVTARSINGQAEFSVHSGTALGGLVVRIEADRADNNVMNGVALPVYNFVNVPVVSVGPTNFSVQSGTVGDLYQGDSVGFAVPVLGGTAPYICSVDSGSLPLGLELTSDCAIAGTVLDSAIPGNYIIRVGVRDSFTIANQGWSQITLPVYGKLEIVGPANLNFTCGQPGIAQIEAQGGKAPLTFGVVGLPAGLELDPATGVISGTIEDADKDQNNGCQLPSGSVIITVTDANGKMATKTFQF